MGLIDAAILSRLNLDDGTMQGAAVTRRSLADLKGAFADAQAYEQALANGNPLLYTVAVFEPAEGDGQLHCALGKLFPGKIGREYYLTKGHYHSWREAAEVYVCLKGNGLMLLENEEGESRLLPLARGTIVYVPGHTAHRTINIGREPLLYLGIYASSAGHDYGAIAERNFRKVVFEHNGGPLLLDRAEVQV